MCPCECAVSQTVTVLQYSSSGLGPFVFGIFEVIDEFKRVHQFVCCMPIIKLHRTRVIFIEDKNFTNFISHLTLRSGRE